jgi:hypothetical protein
VANTLIALGILLGLAVGAILVYRARTKQERRRRKAIADATGRHEPLNADEQKLADAWREDVEKVRTGELPRITDEPRRPRVQEIARRYRRPAKHSARKVPRTKTRTDDALSGPLPAQLERPVMVPARPPSWQLESFTTGWTKREINHILDRHKAGTS